MGEGKGGGGKRRIHVGINDDSLGREREEETQRTNGRGCTSQLENTSEPRMHAAVNVYVEWNDWRFFLNKKAPLDKGIFRLFECKECEKGVKKDFRP